MEHNLNVNNDQLFHDLNDKTIPKLKEHNVFVSDLYVEFIKSAIDNVKEKKELLNKNPSFNALIFMNGQSLNLIQLNIDYIQTKIYRVFAMFDKVTKMLNSNKYNLNANFKGYLNITEFLQYNNDDEYIENILFNNAEK